MQNLWYNFQAFAQLVIDKGDLLKLYTRQVGRSNLTQYAIADQISFNERIVMGYVIWENISQIVVSSQVVRQGSYVAYILPKFKYKGKNIIFSETDIDENTFVFYQGKYYQMEFKDRFFYQVPILYKFHLSETSKTFNKPS